MPKKILLVGGGTGGHVFPLLNLVHYLKKNHVSSFRASFSIAKQGKTRPGIQEENDPFIGLDSRQSLSRHRRGGNDEQMQFHWVGESNSIESKISGENSIPFSPIICGKLRRYFSLKTLLVPFQMMIGFFQSLVIHLREKPSSIFSKGGYVSLPVALAGWTLQIPIYLHESDSIPGLANRIVGKLATGIFTSFPEADTFFDPKKILGHGPLLSEDIQSIKNEQLSPLLEGGKKNGEEKKGDLLGINPPSAGADTSFKKEARTQILISCGSQGSSTIFDVILAELKTENSKLKTFDIKIILGVKNLNYRQKFEKFSNVTIYEFFYNQTEYLEVVQNCDLVIARSGSSIFEFEALGLQMILIPHPHTGNNHQYWNAMAFQKKGHEVILQENMMEQLPIIIEKYRHFKKTPPKGVVDMQIFHTIAQNLLK